MAHEFSFGYLWVLSRPVAAPNARVMSYRIPAVRQVKVIQTDSQPTKRKQVLLTNGCFRNSFLQHPVTLLDDGNYTGQVPREGHTAL